MVGASGSPSGVYNLSGFLVSQGVLVYRVFLSFVSFIRLLVMFRYAGMNLVVSIFDATSVSTWSSA